jgi:L-asparaginase
MRVHRQFRFCGAAILIAAFVTAGPAQTGRPRIAVFSGPTATLQHGESLVTSNKAREKYRLPIHPQRFDELRPQRLAAPVTVYVEAYSAHPLERDVIELYAPPDGYVNPRTGVFSKQRATSADVPVYEVTLRPEDGLYKLPYMARQADGKPWDSDCASRGAPVEKCRITFYPDASRIFEEIDRFGGNLMSSRADFDFYRAAPSGGYRKGLPANLRTDVGEGDIPPEVIGRDFYPYQPVRRDGAMATLARLTNVVQRAMATNRYAGAIWLEGSPSTEETTYWLSLLIDTTVPIAGNASQSGHGQVGNDGDKNMSSSVEYILSGIWKDAQGRDQIGGVMVQEDRAITARDVQKGDDRPGAYLPTGGHGGIVASVKPPVLTFIPVKKHTYKSEVNFNRLPGTVQGVRRAGNRVVLVDVPIKDGDGNLLESAIPKVSFVTYAKYAAESFEPEAEDEVEVSARIEKNLSDFPLSGFIMEGKAPYGHGDESEMAALRNAALHGMPVVLVGRGGDGFTTVSQGDLFIEGSNLTATKARLLLMACLMKFGAMPPAADPKHPTDEELKAIYAKIAQYQSVFETH